MESTLARPSIFLEGYIRNAGLRSEFQDPGMPLTEKLCWPLSHDFLIIDTKFEIYIYIYD